MPGPRRAAMPTPLVGALCGAVLGLLTFGVVATMWRLGAGRLAADTAEVVLLLTLAGVAAAIVSAPPARMRRARAPVGRAVPHQWWPPQHDPVPLVAACVGAPLAVGVGAAVLLFH